MLAIKTDRSDRQNWKQNPVAPTAGNTVSANEITSLSALIIYVAHKSGETQFRVERLLADRFHIANVTCLPSGQFDNALHYLTTI